MSNSLPPPTQQSQTDKPSSPSAIASPLSQNATHLYTLSYLVFFAVFGTLARLGLQALTVYPGAPVVTGILWANVGGSLLMGFFLEDKNLFREEWGSPVPTTATAPADDPKRHKAVKKTIPLYIGLTTGFCGSFTSFSSFIRDVFLALSNDLPDPSSNAPTTPTPRNGGYSFMAVVAVIITTVALSLAALVFGAHLALALAPMTPTFPFRITRRILDPLAVLMGWGSWLGAIFLAIWPPDRGADPATEVWRGRAVFAVVFAPLGCLLRYYVSLALNARVPAFPLGTFAVNIFGTAVLAMCFDLQRVGGIGAVVGSSAVTYVLTSCQVLQGVMDGFCGSATTVSTWVAELNGFGRRRYAYFYGIVSVAVALGFVVIIMGSLKWTRGFATPVCA